MNNSVNSQAIHIFSSRKYWAVIFSFLILTGCQKDEDFESQVNDVLKSLPPISTAFPAEKPVSLENTVYEKETEYNYRIDYYSCAAGYDEQIVLNPQTDVIYPGALIKGETILDGSYVPIVAKRRPVTISTSLTGSGKVSVTVADPKLSTIRTAINSLMNQNYDVPPANLGFTIEQAYSAEQLKLSLRASYSGIVDVSGGFDYSNKKIKSRLVAKFIQNYYTLDMDLPASPADLFEGNVNATIFGIYMPMYISSVTFGRMALFTIESELEETQVRAFLQGSYASVNASASIDFDALKASSTMKVYVLGGSGAEAGMAIDGFEAFKNYIKTGGNFSKQSPGAPISYKLRYIKDNTIGKIVFAANYPIRTAIPRTDNIVYDLKALLYSFKTNVSDPGSECELRGSVTSYVKRLGESNHNHFTGIDMGLNATYVFPDNTTTSRSIQNLLIDDVICIYIDIYEHDDWPNPHDQFTRSTFEVNLGDIVTALGGQGYYESGDMKVMYGSESVIVKFRFWPFMRRLPDA
jgi:thiol-activated cytolysin